MNELINPINWTAWLGQYLGLSDYEASMLLLVIGLLGVASAARFFRGLVSGILILVFLSVIATGSTAGIQAAIEAARDNGILGAAFNVLKTILQPLLDIIPR